MIMQSLDCALTDLAHHMPTQPIILHLITAKHNLGHNPSDYYVYSCFTLIKEIFQFLLHMYYQLRHNKHHTRNTMKEVLVIFYSHGHFKQRYTTI